MSGNVVVAGRFELLELAAKGGMGAVYRALDRETGETVALKVLLGDTDNAALRLTKEGLVLAELIDPGIVRYIAHGLGEDRRPFLAMAWVVGETLGERLARAPLSQAESVDLVMGVAEALGHAHGHGVVHRDVKPSNIVLSDGSIHNPVLIDFGLVRLRASEQTQLHRAMGTPSYMAPEQARCASEVDARADVFSLGCVLFRCLTGVVPFAGPDMISVLTKILIEEPPRVLTLVPSVVPELDQLVHEMLSKDREKRPLNGTELADRLRAIVVPTASVDAVAVAVALPTLGVGLTHDELRLRSILVADVRMPPVSVDGEPDLNAQRFLERVSREAESSGARADLLADGSLVVAFANRGGAAELALRAARCAVGLRALVDGSSMALVTGSSVFGDHTPEGDGDHHGDVFARAASILRAEGRSVQGARIVIDEVTAGLIEARFEVGREGRRTLLLAPREGEDVARTVLGKATRFFGREDELATLSAMVDLAFSDCRARVAVVTAPAGIGKSRLCSELLNTVRTRHPEARILLARGDPTRAGSPFGMLGQMLKRAAGFGDGASVEARSASLRHRIGESITDAGAARIAAFLGEISGASLADASAPSELRAARANPVTMGDQIRRAFEQFLSAELSDHPLVIVLEDLHWGDLSTVSALDAVLRNLADERLAVVAFARPELDALFPELWAERSRERMSLEPLPPKVAARIARSLIGESAQDAKVALLVERAAGNAFFLEEIVRASVTSPTFAFPDTVVAVVQGRIEALSSELRRTLRAASIFGQTLCIDGVRALVGGDDDTQAHLAQLVALELLVPGLEPARSGLEPLVFASALIREAAYVSLTENDRLLGHGLAADWLLAQGESDARVIAEHLDRSGALAEAIAWWQRAAEEALAGADLAGVIDRARRGLACGAVGEELAAFHVLMTEAWAAKGKYHAVRESALQGLQHARRGGPAWLVLAAQAVVASTQVDDLPTAVAWVDELCDAFDGRKDVTGSVVIQLLATATSLMRSSAREDAWRVRDLAEPLANKYAATSPSVAGHAALVDGMFHLHDRSDFGAAVDSFARAQAAFEESGDLRDALRASINRAYALTRLGDGGAVGLLRVAYAEAVRMGLENYAAGAAQNLALALSRAGDAEGARAHIDLSIATSEAIGARFVALWSRLYAVEIACGAGDWADAESRAISLLPDLAAHRAAYVYCSAELSEALRNQGRVPDALAAARGAMAVLDAATIVEEGEEHARLAFARALMESGDAAGAREAIGKARAALLARASLIADPGWRRSYLERIAENAAILSLARAWLSEA